MIKQAILGICASGLLLGGAAWAQAGAGEEQQPSQAQQQGQMQQGQQQDQMQQGQMQQGAQGQMTQFKSNASAKTERQLRQRTREYQRAWNNHDANKMASFYTADATVLNADGTTATGKQEIRNMLQQATQGPAAQGQVELKLQSVRTITPTVALLDIQQTMTGAGQQQGAAQQQGGAQMPNETHASVIATKKGNQWMVAAVRSFPSPQQQQLGVGGAGQGAGMQQQNLPPTQEQNPQGQNAPQQQPYQQQPMNQQQTQPQSP